ncbi:hypothetical protein niasHS_011562 [Heterodera schachtii]|uniref:Uncharacterized protein n=1 Tax=Heterodera schachtii TaxID=97005 RepID=A0ABD2ISM5_HETSC
MNDYIGGRRRCPTPNPRIFRDGAYVPTIRLRKAANGKFLRFCSSCDQNVPLKRQRRMIGKIRSIGQLVDTSDKWSTGMGAGHLSASHWCSNGTTIFHGAQMAG